MRKNDILPLTCEALGADMEGVCRADGMAVFVPGMLPGETAPVRIVKDQKRYAFGKLEGAPVSPADVRREPDCPVYPRCGGCSCRHMTYEATLAAKRQQVADCFQRIGKLDITVPPVAGMADPVDYRNKTALPVGGTADNPCVGFFAPRSHAIIPIDRCPNAMPPADDVSRAVLSWMKQNRVAPYDEATHTGLIRHIVTRVNRQHQALVTLAVNGTAIPKAEELWKKLQPLGVIGLVLNENREKTNVILGRKFRTLFGEGTLKDVLCGLEFDLSPAAFFQVNPQQTEVLYQTALDFAELQPGDRLCDVYCGAGTISLMMARHCKEVLGIEIVPQAIDNAKENALRNGITNAAFRCGAAEEVLPALVDEGLRPDVIVIDPPRKGVEPAVIDAIAKAGPRRVVYVSCNVATQARDAALLVEKGYTLDKVQPVDMFCWTSGVECVAAFTRKDAPEKEKAFFDNAKLLSDAFGITPLLYGSLGLAYLTGQNLHADDIDMLIPETFIAGRWPEFKAFLEKSGYALLDEHEHTFEKGGIHYSYARIEELEPFAGIALSEIATVQAEDVSFKLLSLEQYLKVYTASSKDGYRATVRNKKDAEKIRFIQEQLQK